MVTYFEVSGIARINMELLLNILWMLIAVGLIGIWRTRWIHQRRNYSRRSLREWIAVSLALVLLFFAVSMTDDMHAEIVALEECSATKRDLVCLPGAHALPQSGTALHTFSLAIVAAVPFFGSLEFASAIRTATQLQLFVSSK